MNRRNPTLVYMSAGMKPYADARDDFAILADLAGRTSVREAYTEGRDAAGWTRDLWDRCGLVAQEEGFELPTFDAFKQAGLFCPPKMEEVRIALADFVADPDVSPLDTPSGRIELVSARIAEANLPDSSAHPMWMEPVEWLGRAAEGQLHLLSNQPDTRLHAQFDQGSEAQAAKEQGRKVCTVHPLTAEALGSNQWHRRALPI